jgi:hypothetical protein
MNERHEVKHFINQMDYYMLKQRLRAVLYTDTHAGPEGAYRIRSLYFDNADDKALREKIDGISCRDKFRIRYYNDDTSLLHLEKKSKRKDLCIKHSTTIDASEAQALLDGDTAWMRKKSDSLIQELYRAMHQDLLRPHTIVDYTRDPFTYPAGNVRVTLDHHIRTGLYCTDFLNPDCVTIPVPDDPIILEVKWDAYLPDIVRDTVRLTGRQASAFSKYAACRMYD